MLASAVILTLLLTSMAVAGSLRVGERIPSVALADLTGKAVATGAVAGKTVVIYFWTDACGCKEQLLELKPYAAGLGKKGALFHAINAGQARDKVVRFVTENTLPYTILLDDKAKLAREQFGIKVLPTIFIIDKSGVLREKLIGVVDTKKLQTIIGRYL
jgi:peroxiredoxin